MNNQVHSIKFSLLWGFHNFLLRPLKVRPECQLLAGACNTVLELNCFYFRSDFREFPMRPCNLIVLLGSDCIRANIYLHFKMTECYCASPNLYLTELNDIQFISSSLGHMITWRSPLGINSKSEAVYQKETACRGWHIFAPKSKCLCCASPVGAWEKPIYHLYLLLTLQEMSDTLHHNV